MNFDELQQEWRKEMATAHVLDDCNFEQMAATVEKNERGVRFTGLVFGGCAIAVLFLAGFLLATESVPRTPYKYLQLIGFPVIYAFVAWLYFASIRKPSAEDWTLAARISSEKTKLARQIRLARRVPALVLLPMFLLSLFGTLPDLLDGSSGEPGMGPYIFLGLLAAGFAGVAALLNYNIRTRLQPMLDKITKLEEQLAQE